MTAWEHKGTGMWTPRRWAAVEQWKSRTRRLGKGWSYINVTNDKC